LSLLRVSFAAPNPPVDVRVRFNDAGTNREGSCVRGMIDKPLRRLWLGDARHLPEQICDIQWQQEDGKKPP
jgi:hypothetical protein